SLNDRKIFVTRSSAGSITCGTIHKRSKACFVPFFNYNVELFMRVYIGHSFEENLCHHPFVFVIEKMAMKNGHASDYGVGEVHNDVDRAAVRNIHSVQPHWFGNWPAVFGVRQEMDLMDVHRMQFSRCIDDFPMLIGTYLGAHH